MYTNNNFETIAKATQPSKAATTSQPSKADKFFEKLNGFFGKVARYFMKALEGTFAMARELDKILARMFNFAVKLAIILIAVTLVGEFSLAHPAEWSQITTTVSKAVMETMDYLKSVMLP